jgi:hypothetical protein
MDSSKLAVCLLAATALSAQVVPMTGEDGQRNNEQLLMLRHSSGKGAGSARKVVAFPGDNVIPHVVDGGSWSTAVTLTNLDTRTIRMTVLFFRDDGSDLMLPLAGHGTVRGIQVTLDPSTTLTFSTTGSGSGVSSGWAYIQKEDGHDAVSGMCVFRQRVAGRPDFEAVVPIVSEFDRRAVLLFDNMNSFVTAASFANPNPTPANITFVVRSENASVLERRTMILDAFSHSAGSIAVMFPSTAGRRGSIEFVTSGTIGIGAVGLRFNPTGAFTSFHVLSNIDWLM